MKKQFSKHWKGSKQARKQRKYVANAPLHVKRKMLSCHLTKELRTKYARRSFPVKKGDTVKILNGEYKGKSGKIVSADANNGINGKIAIEGIQKNKKDGSKVNVSFRASNLMITELDLSDNKRVQSIQKEIKKETKN